MVNVVPWPLAFNNREINIKLNILGAILISTACIKLSVCIHVEQNCLESGMGDIPLLIECVQIKHIP